MLSFEYQLRAKAYEYVREEGLTINKGMEKAMKDPETRELHFLGPFGLEIRAHLAPYSHQPPEGLDGADLVPQFAATGSRDPLPAPPQDQLGKADGGGQPPATSYRDLLPVPPKSTKFAALGDVVGKPRGAPAVRPTEVQSRGMWSDDSDSDSDAWGDWSAEGLAAAKQTDQPQAAGCANPTPDRPVDELEHVSLGQLNRRTGG